VVKFATVRARAHWRLARGNRTVARGTTAVRRGRASVDLSHLSGVRPGVYSLRVIIPRPHTSALRVEQTVRIR
jgi:hypothetical protein